MADAVKDGIQSLNTEAQNPASAQLDCLSPLEIARVINA